MRYHVFPRVLDSMQKASHHDSFIFDPFDSYELLQPRTHGPEMLDESMNRGSRALSADGVRSDSTSLLIPVQSFVFLQNIKNHIKCSPRLPSLDNPLETLAHVLEEDARPFECK